MRKNEGFYSSGGDLMGQFRIAVFLILFSVLSFAERARSPRIDPSVLRSNTPGINQPNRFTGQLEMRPTLGTLKGNFSTENYYELHWWLEANKRLTFGETFFSQKDTLGKQVFTPGDGYLRFQVRDFVKNPDSGLSLSGDFRANLPLSKNARDAGLITALRSTLLITLPLNPTTRLELRETPIFYFYKEAGHLGSQGPVSHPIFENRLSFGPVFSLGSSVTLLAPVYFFLTKYRNYQSGAIHNEDLWPDISFSPEIDWQLTENVYIGASYRTEGLLIRDTTGFALSPTAGSGSTQLILGMSF